MTKESKRALGEWLWLAWCAVAVLILLAFVSDANGQENYIRQCSNQYACTLTPVGGTSWSAPVQTYLWTPLSPDVSLRILVHNQNTTNAHTAQTLTLWITGSTRADVSLIGQSDIWVQAAVIQNSTANAKCTAVAANVATTPGASGTGTCYAQGMYAAQMALQFTPGGAQAGTVDNFDISIVQCTAAHCNYPGGPQPGNDSSAGSGANSNVNLSQSAGVAIPATGADAVLNTAQPFPTGNYIFNGFTWDRIRAVELASSSVAAGAFTPQPGMLYTEKGSRWMINSNPASGTTASATRAAVVSQRHVLDCFTFAADSSAAVAATQSSFVIRDGATGVGTIIWVVQDAISVAAGLGIQTQGPLTMCGLNLVGSSNTAMTCEFTDAGVSGNHQSVSCSGYDIQ